MKKTCEQCGKEFEAKIGGRQKYCNAPCNWMTARQKGMLPSQKGVPEKMASRGNPDDLVSLELMRAELQQERAQVAAMRTELRRELTKRDSVRELVHAVQSTIETVQPVPLSTPPVDPTLPAHEWVLCTSDWHIGQLTTLEETGGLFEQSSEIAISQVQTLWAAISQIHDIESAGREIRKLHILSLGDMVDGDLMRISQTRKIDKLVAEQYPIVYGLKEALVRAALTKFDEVEVHVVGGNHDRFGKYGDAGMGELAYIENWAFIMGTSLEAAFVGEPRVTVRNHQSFFGTAIIAGHKFAFSHGSDVNWRSNSYAGLPYYSLNVAAERMKAMVDGYDVLVMGHGHVPMQLPVGFDSKVVMNGSLPGSSTFVQSKYKSVRRPSQALLSMHRRLGMTAYTQLYLDHAGVHPAGDAWGTEPAPTAKTFDLTER